ncbi:uncharacterized protein LOC126834411 isoform X2 [Adelges cooleyi]|uniref:uncharacterized protein LOC126834411 isoform X2 n=1 Tax=Adelges cooleyi TaxID=133065 RepID=UPI00217FFB1C|nr:uncharacterized protein LOC126834411 isoform X2 [Adelges cooleyi]
MLSSSVSVACSLMAVLSVSVLCGAWADCPASCECMWRSGKESAICTEANMTAVPRHLDYGTQLLDLAGNPLYRLGKDVFVEADLLNLQKLFMSRCRIRTLDRYAFRKLTNLVELDLSHNSLAVVPSTVFEEIPELRELRLNGNPLLKVPNSAFRHVPRLVKLDLSECRIALLESTAFAGLENSLEWLKLDNNQLRDVKPSTLVSLAKLHGVQLNENPWNCSCKLRPIREWMVKRNVPFGAPPVCKSPARLSRISWDKLELDDFACEPHANPVMSVVQVTEGDNATVSCRMSGVPLPTSRWTRNDRPIGNNGRSVPVTSGRYTNLTIVSVVAQDGGSYTCLLENRSGSSKSNITVVVMKRSPELTLAADRFALPGLIVGVILVLSFCLIFLCGLAIRTKGNPTRFADRGGTFDRYEKIEMNHKVADNHQTPVAQPQPVDKACESRPDPPDYTESVAATAAAVTASNRIPKDDEPTVQIVQPVPEPDLPHRVTKPSPVAPHRPRKLPAEPGGKDDKKRTYLECNMGEVTLHHHVLHKESLPAGNLYTTAAGRQDLCNPKNVPDLLDTALLPAKSRRLSQTLPRSTFGYNNRRNTMYAPRVTSDSQSPLLNGSRSSGGSNASRSQLSFDSSVESDHPRRLSTNQKSSSFLNLSTGYAGGGHHGRDQQHHQPHYWTPPSLPSSPARERRLPATPPVSRSAAMAALASMTAETPILDPLSSRRRLPHHQSLGGSNHSLLSSSDGASITYDYHTAQLDMFLEEYKHLRKELTKMQRTCDTLRLSNASLASSQLDVKPEQPTVRTPKSILKNRNQATYVYTGGGRRSSLHQLDAALQPSDEPYLG